MTVLPAGFDDLEAFASWCLATEDERYRKRLGSTLVEMRAFYDAITPRAEAALEHCDQFSLDDLPVDATNLMWLLHSMVMVSFPVEVWHQPRVPDSGASTLVCISEPVP